MTELTPRRKYLVLATCCIGLFMATMDNTILNIGLPAIGRSLHASVSDLQWTVDAYTVTLATLLILAGWAGDRFGRRRVFQLGLGLFTVGSFLCSVAPGLHWLIGFRILQAVGGSMLNPVAMSIITNVFTGRQERARVIGIWIGVSGLSFGLGPPIGGLLIASFGWRAMFWVNIPVGIAAVVLVALLVPESKAPRSRRLDLLGQLALIALLGGLTYAIIESPTAGWLSARTLPMFGLALAGLVVLLIAEPRRREPLIDLRLFRSMAFAGASILAVCCFFAYGAFLFLSVLYLQSSRGMSATMAGVSMLPLALGLAGSAPLSGRVVAARGPRIPLVVSGSVLVIGSTILLNTHPGSPIVETMLAFFLFGIGIGTMNTPITRTAVSGMPDSQAGVAAAMASTSRQVGATLGVAVVGSLLNSGLHGRSLAVGFEDASPIGWWVILGCSAATLLLGPLISSARAESILAPKSRQPDRAEFAASLET